MLGALVQEQLLLPRALHARRVPLHGGLRRRRLFVSPLSQWLLGPRRMRGRRMRLPPWMGRRRMCARALPELVLRPWDVCRRRLFVCERLWRARLRPPRRDRRQCLHRWRSDRMPCRVRRSLSGSVYWRRLLLRSRIHRPRLLARRRAGGGRRKAGQAAQGAAHRSAAAHAAEYLVQVKAAATSVQEGLLRPWPLLHEHWRPVGVRVPPRLEWRRVRARGDGSLRRHDGVAVPQRVLAARRVRQRHV